MLKATLVFLFAMPLMASASTLYRCIDEFGHATYTNYKGGARKCTILSREDSSPTESAKPAVRSRAAANPSPTDFPKVGSETQKSRDGDRRYILEQEVEAEKKHLDEARKSLAELLAMPSARSSPDRAQPIRDRITLHERNLDALHREISNLK